MKYKGCKTNLSKERDAELLRTFETLLRQMSPCTMTDVYEALSASPCRRYWVTGDRAIRAIYAMRKMEDVEKLRARRYQMYIDIERKARELMKERPHMTFSQAVFKVVRSPAPSFYVDRRTIQNIFTKLYKSRCL